jgi:hypothetical protein
MASGLNWATSSSRRSRTRRPIRGSIVVYGMPLRLRTCSETGEMTKWLRTPKGSSWRASDRPMTVSP